MTETPNKFVARAKSTSKLAHNSKYLQFGFDLVQPFSRPFQAGQYVSLKIGPQGELRSYSICSSPAIQNSFNLLIDVTPQGVGTTYLKNLGVGDEVEVLGPLGRFALESDQINRPAVFNQWTTHFFSGRADTQAALVNDPNEHEELRWFAWEELEQLESQLAFNHYLVLQEYFSNL